MKARLNKITSDEFLCHLWLVSQYKIHNFNLKNGGKSGREMNLGKNELTWSNS